MSPTPTPTAGPGLPPAPEPLWADPPVPDPSAVASLEAALSLPAALCSLLEVRGYGDQDRARAFLRPLLDTLADPLSLADMEKAVERVDRALESGETILVHGDYDADGICGTALLVRCLKELGGDAVPFVPDRLRDGYDFGPAGLEAAVDAGAGLVVTVDCGIRAHETVELAGEEGVDVVITDHHAPGEDLPDAAAVVNPARTDCDSPAGPLSGTGVAYTLCRALAARRGRSEEELHPHLDLVAMATVADLVPLRDENRTLVRFGLKALRRTRKPGLRALIRETGSRPEELDAGKIGFVLAPRINAAGRVGDAGAALRLLLTEDETEAASLAAGLESVNRDRRREDRRIEAEALELLEATYDPDEDYGVVLASEGWHPGVIGIVASRLVERIHRPVVLVALQEGMGRGSARSIRGFHLAEVLERCAGHLERFGGHAMAAGMDVRAERLAAFRGAFRDEARRLLEGSSLRPELRIDLEVSLADADSQLQKYMEYMGPFGISNRRPVLLCRRLRAVGARTVGSGHLKLHLERDGRRLECIGFGLAGRIPPERVEGREVDAVFQLRMDRYRNRNRLQGRLLDLRPAGAEGWAAETALERGDRGAA